MQRNSVFLSLLCFTLITMLLVTGCKEKSSSPAAAPPTSEPQQYGTPYANVPDAVDMVLYEINERAFSSEGTFAGFEKRLDSIKSLGINTIWLMPIFPIGQIKSAGGLGSPYSVQNFLDVNPEYGSLQSLRSLVTKAHSLGMAVLLDFVANHTSWDNPWIQNKAWYSQDGNGNIIIPPGTNWQDVAELNYNNNEMRTAMIQVMKYWILEANVDGYRFDAADLVPADFWTDALKSLNAIPGRKLIFLAEGSSVAGLNAGFQLNYSWDFYTSAKNVFKSGQSATNLYTTHQNELAALPAGKLKLRFITNHDESAWDDSPVNLFGSVKASTAAFVASVYTGGVPLVYNGQEVGVATKIPFFTKSTINWNQNSELVTEYRKILTARSSMNAVKKGSLLYYNNSDVFACKKTYNDEQALIIINVRNTTIMYTVHSSIANTQWINALNNASVLLGNTLTLAPYEYLILKNK